MKPSTWFWALISIVLLASPVVAGTVYVPLAAELEVGTTTYRTWVWLLNPTDSPVTVEHHFITSFSSGTVRNNQPSSFNLQPGQQRILWTPQGQGMWEFFAPNEVQIQARLIAETDQPSNGQGIALPVITSENLVGAGETAYLLGWARRGNGTRTSSNFGLINLGRQATGCEVSVWNSEGTPVVQDVPLSFEALSHNQFQNVLAILGATEAVHWQLAVSCDQPFFPYLSLYYPETGRLAFQQSATSGNSDLVRPSNTNGDNFHYQADRQILRFGGLDLGPYLNSSGAEFHDPAGWFGGHAPMRINGVTYEKGVSFYPSWGQVPFIEYDLDGQYTIYTADVRIDDYYFNKYEWAVVDVGTGQWRRLERPGDGYHGVERENPIRVGAAASYRVIGDGVVLYQSPEIYAYGPPDKIEIDVTGVQILRLELDPDGTEQLEAPYRNGLTEPRLVNRASWFDMIDFADGKFFY